MKQPIIALLVMATTATAGCNSLLGDRRDGEVTLFSSSHPHSENAERLRRDLERRLRGQQMRDEMASRRAAEASDESTDRPSEEYTAEMQEFIDTLNQLVQAGLLSVAERDEQWDSIAGATPELLAKFLPSVTAGLKHRLQGLNPAVSTRQTPTRPAQSSTTANTVASTPAVATVEPATRPTTNQPTTNQPPYHDDAEVKQTSHVAAAPDVRPPQRDDRVDSPVRDERPKGWQDHVLAAVTALERQRGTKPGEAIDPALETRLRLLQLAAGRKEEALADLPQNRAMSAAERRAHQDFLQAVVAGLDEYMQHDRDEFEPAEANLAKATGQFRRAADRLGQLATLGVSNVTLCRKVDDYGVVEPFASKTFRSDQEVMLYAEVENFVSELVSQSSQTPTYRTALKSSYRVFDGEGREVGKGSAFKTIKDLCRSYRRDFFVAYRIYLPKHMYDGTHTLTLTIEDTLGQKIGQGSVQLEVAAGNKMGGHPFSSSE